MLHEGDFLGKCFRILFSVYCIRGFLMLCERRLFSILCGGCHYFCERFSVYVNAFCFICICERGNF